MAAPPAHTLPPDPVQQEPDPPPCDFRKDLWGYPIRTHSDACIQIINDYYHQVLVYGSERRIILKAADADRSCVLACALAAGYILTQQDVRRQEFSAGVYLRAAKYNLDRATRYERLVLEVVTAWADGQITDVLDLHFQLVTHFPRDLVSLKRGQTLCFYMGRQEDMLKLAMQTLPANKESPYLYGMLAFALVEVGGRMREAEAAARHALAIESHDVWAQHAVHAVRNSEKESQQKDLKLLIWVTGLCHVLQHECRFQEALVFMTECSNTWSSCCAFLYTHNWWHMAVCELEQSGADFLEGVLEKYDTRLWVCNDEAYFSKGCLNALGLLLRLDVRGHHRSVDSRLANMQGCLLGEVTWFKEWLQDLLVVWGLSRGGHIAHADRLLQSLTLRVEELELEEQKSLQCVLLLAKALFEYGLGNYQAVCHLLGPDSRTAKYKVIGASEEQLDVFEELWCDVFLLADQPLPVVQVAERRVLERCGVPFTWRILERAYTAAGEVGKAKDAEAKASGLESAATVIPEHLLSGGLCLGDK